MEGAERALLSFTAALSGGELDVATSHFARDAYLLTPDATAVRGRESIRLILAQLIARRTQIHVQAGSTLAVGAVALSSGRWTLRSVGVDGSAFEQTCGPTMVLRRIEDVWKLVIAALWG